MKTLFKGDIVQCIDNDFGKVWRHVRLPILYEFYTVSDTIYFQNEDCVRVVFEEHLQYQAKSMRYQHPDYGHLRYLKEYAFPAINFKFITTYNQLNKQLNFLLNPSL